MFFVGGFNYNEPYSVNIIHHNRIIYIHISSSLPLFCLCCQWYFSSLRYKICISSKKSPKKVGIATLPFDTEKCQGAMAQPRRRSLSETKLQTMGDSTNVITLQGINISHLGKRKIIFKMPFLGDMLVSWRVDHGNFWIYGFLFMIITQKYIYGIIYDNLWYLLVSIWIYGVFFPIHTWGTKKTQPELGLMSWFGMTIPYCWWLTSWGLGIPQVDQNKKKSYQNHISY